MLKNVKLEKFLKSKNKKKVMIYSLVSLVLLIGIITLYKTFALYEEKLELNLIQGIVPIFNNDMQLTYTIDGLKGNDPFPDKNSIYLAKDVTCDNGITASFDNGTWGLVNISSSSDKIKCNVNFVTPSITNLSSVVKVGDYIKMTPYNLTNVYNIVPS